MQLPVSTLEAYVVGEAEGETGGGGRGLGGVYVDVVEHGGVESRNTEAHEGKLDSFGLFG